MEITTQTATPPINIYKNHPPPKELYFMTRIENITTILSHGILSNKRSQSYKKGDMSNSEVQSRRHTKKVPNAERKGKGKKELTIHQHANLYIRAQNGMMHNNTMENKAYSLPKAEQICVLRIDPAVLKKSAEKKCATSIPNNATKCE